MKGVYLFLVYALAGHKAAANVDHIKSTDQLVLTYQPSEAYPLFVSPGSTTELHFKLKNNGDDSRFAIRKSSSIGPEVFGESISEIFVERATIQDFNIGNIQIPVQPEKKVTMEIEVSPMDESITNTMDSAKKSVVFTIGEAVSEQEPPQIEHWVWLHSDCKVKDTACQNSTWDAEFKVHDLGVGLQSLDIQTMGKDSHDVPLFYKYHNFAIGSTDEVTVITHASCCVEGVSVTATDLQNNQGQDFLLTFLWKNVIHEQASF
ncbi:uncharacterized protein LOC131891396 isoform X2 [Tigriopus californicus]|uniref:uncharacterized protein LOC131891396 isoform X2 n=1 Tax=Tigriopus californicus TaxID=6832 RepID=UPI0027DAA1A2|nr:uncharacterized protein LOC131891396 isoform X2 [Tigriopus californicus]